MFKLREQAANKNLGFTIRGSHFINQGDFSAQITICLAEMLNSTALLTFVKETLGDKVAEVVESKKLVSHPVCLTAKGGISFEMEKYFNSVQPDSGMKAQRVLELNLGHASVQKMESLIQTDIDKAKKYAEVLYCQALLIAGLPLENPSAYTDLVCSLI